MRLDVKRQLYARSERVKGIDFHPHEPWILTTLYSGHVYIWSYETQQIVKTFELTDVPVRAGRFIARKNWIVCGSDDFQLRVYNYNTAEKITSFEAHPDYIRAIAVHPTQPFVLTASDDMSIKLWDWERGWKCVQVFEGHSHYVMGLAINPKDTNTFASACLDRTVKIWNLGSPTANFTLEAHETKGVNHVDYYPHSDKPYILTTSDDRTVKVWDYTTKSLIATLEGHTNNVSFACYHPELPVIISGSEDGTLRIWHANTYRFEQSLNYSLERAWCVSYQKGKQGIAVGYDDGAVVVKLGREEPAVSMDASGKLIWARHNEVVSSIIKGGGGRRRDRDTDPVFLHPDASIKDNEPISLPTKDLGTCEVYPQTLTHSPNGRFVSVCGDGEYIIYTALAWRNKAFGSALDFVWASKENSNDFAIRESPMSVKVYKNFVEKPGGLDVGFQADGLTGGVLLGVTGQGGVSFFDWATGGLVRRIEVEPKQVYWSDSGELVAIACEDTFYVLRFSRENYVEAVQAGQVEEDGVESAFEVITDISESVRTGEWVGDCFIYTNSTNRLNYLVGDQTYTVSHFDKPMYILGYIQRDSRIYIADKDVGVTSFSLSLPVLEYQTLVLREDMETAAELLPTIPDDQMNKIARFLEGQGHKELALEVVTDPEHKFELALALSQLDIALELAREADVEHKWKTVGDAALAGWDVALAAECFTHAKDLGSLLLVHSSTGDRDGLAALAKQAEESGAHNIAFTCNWLLGNVERCAELLSKTGRQAEAVLFSETYKPSLTASLVKEWKDSLEKNKKSRVAKLIGVPDEDEDLFPEWDTWLKLESEGGSAAAPATTEIKPDDEDEDEDEAEVTNGHDDGEDDDE
ncbi:coatomer subunit beta' [Geosmithia morbida]|uniref:Coatomer subunit beta' n=1 Tax=Geosmithia morbida TaxID=1094350 RepID=A0A9P5D4N8_9HYPO|nr:coatomer subunit beta' [Geosmithia morbida]KAF4122975.1 coatomer subunit beta' [Geosmithia morbida]